MAVRDVPRYSAAAGQKQAILEGEPGTPGKPFTMLLWLPDGHRVPPHRHPVDENLTVLRGTWQMGAGEKYDETAMRELGTGAYVWMPAEQAHFGRSKGETIVQLHGIGPFKVDLVNPKDPFAGAIYKSD
jgi:quercetin dioxygenase-like cupin family protein